MTEALPGVSYEGPPRHASGQRGRRTERDTRPGGRASRRDRRPKRSRRPLIIAVVAVLVVLGALGAWTVKNDGYLFGVRTPLAAADYEGTGGEPVEVEVPEGANGYSIAAELVEQDVVASSEAFVRAFNANPDAAAIQPGTHELKLHMSAESAVALLATNAVVRGGLTVVEGHTVAQIRETMVEAGWPEQDVRAALDDPQALGLPAEAGGHLEGWLAASTYDAKPGSVPAADVLKQMVALTVSELKELDVPPAQWNDVIIKASLVEREAPDEYRGQVARVIENRLAANEPLGLDAIDSYGRKKPSHLITTEEFQDESFPYASRVVPGLPPTAIGAPSRASVEAVLHPPAGPWRWYVTVNLDSQETKFTDDYDEFLEFREEYQAWAAENGY
ncbi:endolytic transglycosylase MltG [Promicromonospora sp. MS192]|uniref:endolytic transglycosylase MltG n=1 Tax=Promicromonospora sp. MS192 TaxID=3412684 RepID=UPI003C2EF71D